MLIYEYIKKLLMNEKKTKCVSLLKYFIKFIKNLKIKIRLYKIIIIDE